jgi:hypothetical protein
METRNRDIFRSGDRSPAGSLLRLERKARWRFSVIRLTRKGVVFSGTQEGLASLREKYERDDYVILPRLFEPALFEELLRRVEDAPFVPRDHDGIALELCMADKITTAMMDFFPNNPSFLRLVEQITGQPRLGEFNGRVYRMTSSDGHFDHWHNDCIDDRVVTMSVNLSRQVYSGGALQIRGRSSKEILQEIYNTGFGDALLFRISKELAHRVQAVTGEVPKTAYAGWFLQREDLLPNLGKRMQATSRRLTNVEGSSPAPVLQKKV